MNAIESLTRLKNVQANIAKETTNEYTHLEAIAKIQAYEVAITIMKNEFKQFYLTEEL